MPKRRFPHGTASYVGEIALERAGGRIIFRSLLERDVLALLEFDPCVLSIGRNDLSDLERITFEMAELPDNVVLNVTEGTYTPDLRVVTEDGLVLVEVGPLADKGSSPMRERLAEARAEAIKKGVILVVMTERETRLGDRLANVNQLRSHLAYRAREELIATVRDMFEQWSGRLSVAEATAQLSQRQLGVGVEEIEATVWYVIARAAHEGRLIFPLDTEELRVSTAVALRESLV
jgi:hypothetical protein